MLTTLLASLLALTMILVAAGLLRRLRAAQVAEPHAQPSPRVLPTERIPDRQLRHEALMSRGRALGLML